jgi:glycosidase
MFKIYKIKFVVYLSLLLSNSIFSQSFQINKIEPPNWWSGMKYNNVQFMIYGKNLNNISTLNDLNELKIEKIYKADNSNYCFLDISIPVINRDSVYKIYLTNKVDTLDIEIPVFVKDKCNFCYEGFSSSDIIYLITPDRFSDGDVSNNIDTNFVPGYPFGSEMGRHGGDIQGIINHLDYIQETGFTAIWITPLLENNSKMSYHGYAATNLYKIDPRFGTNELYKELVHKAHQEGIKIIYDHVNNHIGINHPWVNNPPFNDWFNGTKQNHFITTHDKISIYSSYSSELTKDSTIRGWFVDEMPDLNQSNPFVATYLTQNMLWWIEYSGLDGIREDTYPYSDQKFLSKWNSTILNEYPNFNITGEVWIEDPAFLAQYQKDSKLNTEINTNLPSVIDFGLYKAIRDFCLENGSINDLYVTLAKDFLYPNPNNLLTFADNHDIERLMYAVNGNVSKFKLALTFLLTTRGIPEIYYGTEIGMVGGKSHGLIREEFPGGFPNDKRNAFYKNGRTELENQIYDFTKNLIELRKTHTSLQNGKIVHFPPKNELYIYFRYDDNEKILVAINNSEKENIIDLNSYKSLIGNNIKLPEILLGKEDAKIVGDYVKIKAKSSAVLLLK